MQRVIGQAVVETVAAESPKFTAPMLLIHGLWCAAPVWRRFMGYFAHRGWTCHALNLRGHGASPPVAIGSVRLADYQQDVRQAVEACESPPVLVGHDLGALLALWCGQSTARAIVALAPLVPRAVAGTKLSLASGLRTLHAMRRSQPVSPPRGKRATACFASGPPGGAAPDSGYALRELAGDTLHLDGWNGPPTLTIAGERDSVCPPALVEKLARRLGATWRTVPEAGHALPWEPGWERRVAEIHRWLIQTLGEPLLLPREPED